MSGDGRWGCFEPGGMVLCYGIELAFVLLVADI